MEESAGIRLLTGRLAAALTGLWMGYFLCRDSQTVDTAQIVLLGLSVLAGYGGVWWALKFKGGRRAAVVLALVSLAAAGGAAPLSSVCAAVLVLVAFLHAREPGAGAAGALASGAALAAASVFAALIARGPDQLPAATWAMVFAAAVAFAAYVGVAESVRVLGPAARSQFAILFVLPVGGLLILAALGLGRPSGIAAGVLFLWLAVRVAWYGRYVLMNFGVRQLGAFAESALTGCGILAGGLLLLGIPEGREAMGEMAWPLIAAASSVVLIRLMPYVGRRGPGAARE